MKIAIVITLAGAGLAAALRWTPLGAKLRTRWATVVRMERHR